jgi:protein-tyrosine phosphatase
VVPVVTEQWPRGRARDGGIDRVPLPNDAGGLLLCGKHAVGPDVEAALHAVGATTVVCLTERFELLERYPEYVRWLEENRGGRAVWFPIPDLDARELSDVLSLVSDLCDRVGAGETLLVHCGAGIGRAGTIAACLLIALGMSAEGALSHVGEHRPMAGPEVGAQRTLVDSVARAR